MKSRLWRIASLAFVLVAIAMSGAPVAAQSLLTFRGLGFPVEPLDARTRGLGGVSTGFVEPEISWLNPAAAVGLAAPGGVLGYQYDNFDSTLPESVLNTRTARFPLMYGVVPVSDRLVLVGGYGSFLEQRWHLERADSLELVGGDKVEVIDQVSSDGALGRLRAGAGYGILEGLAVGLTFDFYAGELRRIQGRRFPGQQSPQCCSSTWDYDGVGVTAGAEWRPSGATGVSLAATYGGTLKATPVEGEGAEVSYDMPLALRAGASGRIGQTTLLTLGGSWDGWSSLNEALVDEGGAQDSWSLGGGLEWDGLLIADRPLPLRVGGRIGTLPFRWSDEDAEAWADERALTLGAGLVLATGGVRTDFAAEFGDRGSPESGLDESFWRVAFSVRVLGR